jgi:hypothetical protein
LNKRFKNIFAIFLIVFSLSTILNPSIIAKAQVNESIKFFSLESKPFGISPEELVINYWKTFLSIPASENPWDDKTGEKCTYGQNLKNASVFYLPTMGDGKLERTCTIPSGLGIVIPIIIGEASFAEFPDIKTIEELHDTAKTDADKMESYYLKINDTKADLDLSKYRIHTKAFDVTFPQNAIFGAEPGKSKVVADGYYVITTPLKQGKYKINFGGNIPNVFLFDLTYNLIVK